MGRVKRPGFYLYTDDILSSDDCCDLSREGAGVYLFLLCRLAKQPMPGCYRLGWHEHKSHYKYSLTNRCLQNPDKYERLRYFADLMAQNHLPWKRQDVLPCLQELYDKGIILVERDMLIQPRMWLDQHIPLENLDIVYTKEQEELEAKRQAGDGSEPPLEITVKKGAKKSADKSTEKGTQKSTEISHPRVGAGDAPAQSKRVGVGDNNKGIDSSSIGGVGESSQSGEKAATGKPAAAPPAAKTGKPARQPVGASPPTIDDVQAYFDERRSQQKPLRYIAPDEFMDICTVAGWTRGKKRDPIYDWKAYLRQCDLYRERHGDHPVYDEQGNKTISNEATTGYTQYRAAGTPRAAQPDADHPDNRQLVEQTVRIMQELRSEGERDPADEVF